MKERFIELSFSDVGLSEFENYKELINICAQDLNKLYKLIPNLLRTLLENLIYRIFLDGLSLMHKEFYFLPSKNRARDFSELIELLNILKDDPKIKPININIITDKTIQYLHEFRIEGNIDTHSIIPQITSNYVIENKQKINILLESLLTFYRSIKDKNIYITDLRTLNKITSKLTLSTAVNKHDIRTIIDEIKKSTKEKISDLIVDLEEDRLLEIVEKMLAELIIKANDSIFSELHLFITFIFHSIRIKEYRLKIFKLLMSQLKMHYNLLDFDYLKQELASIIELEPILLFCKGPQNLSFFINIYKESYSYRDAELKSKMLDPLTPFLNESQWNDIIKAFDKNSQLNEAFEARGFMHNWAFHYQEKISKENYEILKRHKIELSPSYN